MAEPLKTFLADADAIAQRRVVLPDPVEEMVGYR